MPKFNLVRLERKAMDDKKQGYPKFTPTVATIKISSPFINKTESTRRPVKFVCTGVQEQQHNSED